jgi:RHS repeat-associated protein
VSSAGAATYYHYDQTGNTAMLTDQAGAVIDRISYSAYGEIRYRMASHDTPFLYGGFFGVMTDANGLICMRARYYNPLTKRFLTSDPAMDGMNWYAYADGNPVNLADPTGLGAAKVVNAINSGLTSVGFAPINTSVINGPVSGFIHYVAGDKRPATLGPGLLQSIKNVQMEKPQLFSPTPTPENLGVFDYATIKHPIDTLKIGFSLGNFRYTSDGSTLKITDTYAFPFSQSDHRGGTTYHNAALSQIFGPMGSPYEVSGQLNMKNNKQ